MGHYNLERAARDPYYRIAFEDQQRQDKLMRNIAQTRARGAASSPDTPPSSSFSLPPSPGSSYSGYSSSGGHSSGEPDAVDRFLAGLFAFFAPVAVFAAVSYVMLWLCAHHYYSGLQQIFLVVLFLLMLVGFVVNYWRQVAVIAAGAALYYGVHLI